MAIGFPAGITSTYIVNNAQSKLAALRNALEDVENFYNWLSNYAQSDLEASPVSLDTASTSALFSAFADAHELYNLYNGGTLGTYALPYNFSASQSVVIGPLS